MSALFLPALCIAVILAGLLARTNVYDAFVRGAEEGLATLIQIAPCLCAILSATALWRETGLLTALTDGLKPVFAALRLPGEAASVVLLRPLSGSAALAAVNDVIRQCSVDSRAARLACVISGESETVFLPRRSIWARRTSNVRVSRRSRGAAGLCGGGAGGAAGLKQEVKAVETVSALDRNRQIEYNNPKWFYMLLTSRCGLSACEGRKGLSALNINMDNRSRVPRGRRCGDAGFSARAVSAFALQRQTPSASPRSASRSLSFPNRMFPSPSRSITAARRI